MSLLACVMSDGGLDAAGRSGVGAVMGAKHLKAIAVRGTGEIPVADRKRLSALRRDILKAIRESPWCQRRTEYGTMGFITLHIEVGDSAIKNWRLLGAESFPGYSNFDADKLVKYKIKRHTCWGCPITCKGAFRVEKGPYAVKETAKTEYETFTSFGSMCFNDNVESVIKAGDTCNRYGIDTISTGSAIAFAMECYERGIISKKETEGIELTWGNAPALLAMLDKIVRREGFGAILADGVKKAAEQIGRGSEKYAMHVGGQELAYHDSRYATGYGVTYFCDPTPGRHTAGYLTTVLERGRALGPYPELQFPKVDFFDYQAKGPMHATGSSFYQLINACGLCLLPCMDPTLPVADLISAVTGWDYTMSEGIRTGRRIQTLRQAFNLREDLQMSDFHLPERISSPPTTGPFVGRKIDFGIMRENFYKAMGWETKSGQPLEATLRELALKELVKS